jgi:uncharacterized protein (DUF433 family)
MRENKVMNWKEHIIADPEILAGKPTIKGTRLSVEMILDRLADGWSAQELFEAYPRLTPQDLQAVFAFAAEPYECDDNGMRRRPLPA